MLINRQIRLAARPVGYPKQSDFNLVEVPASSPAEGQMLIRIVYLSLDPYMRSRMDDGSSYSAGVKIGEVMVGGTVGKVIESKHPDYRRGDIVEGRLGWQEYAVSDGTDLRRIDPNLAPVSTALSVLGMPGLTAYFGMLDIAQPRAGDVVVVSGAAGAVGSVAGQIGKIRGCRVVGIAGSDAKINYIVGDLGFDAAFNYKSVENYYEVLREICPDGIDVYFDNVGGTMTDAVFRLLRPRARIAVCGQISQYNLEKPEMGPRILPALLVKQARAEGFLVFQFAARYEEGLQHLAQWLKEGRLKYARTSLKESRTPGRVPLACSGTQHGQAARQTLGAVARL